MHGERWRQIDKIFHDAMERKPRERAAFLDLVCARDPELRREIEELISSHEKTGNFLATPAYAEVADTLSCSTGVTTRQAPRDLLGLDKVVPGMQLGPYRIEALIGAGGMGTVFRATDPRLSRQVAIKVFEPGDENMGVSTNDFLQEARAASALNHPNIVIVHDVGFSEELAYIVMELVEGHTLREVMASGPLSIPKILAIARQIGDALAAAHAKGIVHRDLKPANVMITAEGNVKVLDFGLAKRIVADDELQDQTCTTGRAIVGTFGYMSPEQTRGEALDSRSDQFSFGVVMYEMGTGRRAFAGATNIDTLAAIMRDQPEPMRRLNAQVPAPLEWIVERCLAKACQDRYPSTRDLLNDLDTLAGSLSQLSPSGPARTHNLPSPRTALVGREQQLTNVRDITLRQEVRLLTLTGPGGIGKTRLAVELGRRLLDKFPGGVIFVPLDRISHASLVPSEIAQAMKIRQSDGETSMAALERHVLSVTAPTLLILDNFEHVLPAIQEVIPLLSASDQLKVIVTSRVALRAYGEYEYPVPPLELPDRTLTSPKVLIDAPAVALFLERAPAFQIGGAKKLDESQIRLVAEICTRLDGLPLAIELAAARTKVLPLRALLDRVRDPLHLLVGGPKDVPERQRTLRATLDWSHNLLGPEQQRLFRRFSVFVGGATHEAIEAVASMKGDLDSCLLDAIESLVDNSLVRPMAGDALEPRFSMLETMREYGLGRLADAGEETYVRKAHAAYYVVLAEDGNSEMAGPLRELWFGRFNAEMGNFRAALDWLISAGEAQWGMRMVSALVPYLRDSGSFREISKELVKILALPAATIRNHTRGWALAAAADLWPETSGSFAMKLKFLEESLEILEQLQDRQGTMRVNNSYAAILNSVGDHQGARAKLEQLVKVAREFGEPSLLAGALSNLGVTLQRLGEYETARQLHEESSRLFEAAGNQIAVTWGLSHLADVDRDQGHPDRARSQYEQALERFRSLQHQIGIASCYFDLATLETDANNYPAAERLLAESLRIYAHLGYRADLPRVLEAYACCASASARPERALTLAGSAAALLQQAGLGFDKPKPNLDRYLKEARRMLPGSQAASSWMRGWSMLPEEAVRFALGSS